MQNEDQSVPWIRGMDQMHPESRSYKLQSTVQILIKNISIRHRWLKWDLGRRRPWKLVSLLLLAHSNIHTTVLAVSTEADFCSWNSKDLCKERPDILSPSAIWAISLISPLTLIFPLIDDVTGFCGGGWGERRCCRLCLQMKGAVVTRREKGAMLPGNLIAHLGGHWRSRGTALDGSSVCLPQSSSCCEETQAGK